MGLTFYNTLTREKEAFEPLEDGRVRMYTCGPTVYDRAHIGNFRTFTWEDLLRRYLEWKGYEVEQVMNLTDVDDKTIAAAVARGVGLSDVTDPVVEAFFEDWDTLGLERVEHTPRATECVDDMIELVRRLERNGTTYVADGSVYFDISAFDGYGALSGVDPDALEETGRARSDEEYSKDDPRDFVLWKGGDRPEEGDVATWDSPWGPGRPGWHLECSTMAMKFLGDTLDIHTGGVDNIFPHHENEIAQSEAATGHRFVRTWLHAAHLLVDGGKMSKSLGNFYTLPDLLERGERPSAIRYLLLSAHYRAQLNFTLEGLEKADRALDRIMEFRSRLVEESAAPDAVVEAPENGDPLAAEAAAAEAEFERAMDDDLNVSEALAAVFGLVREGNALLDGGRAGPRGRERARAFLEDFDAVFGVLSLREGERELPDEVRRWLEDRIAERQAARDEGDYERADAIRDEVESRGILLEDTPEGVRWKLRETPTGTVEAGSAEAAAGGRSPGTGGAERPGAGTASD